MLITISRQYAAGGSLVATEVAEALNWSVVDNEFIDRVAARAGMTHEEVAAREERVPSFIERLALTLATSSPELFPPATGTAEDPSEAKVVKITESLVAELAETGHVVLVGRAAPAVLGQRKGTLHVRLVAPEAFRVRVAVERLGLPPDEATATVHRIDRNRQRYHRQYYGRDWDDATNYDMVLNTGWLGFDGAAALIVARAEQLGWR